MKENSNHHKGITMGIFYRKIPILIESNLEKIVEEEIPREISEKMPILDNVRISPSAIATDKKPLKHSGGSDIIHDPEKQYNDVLDNGGKEKSKSQPGLGGDIFSSEDLLNVQYCRSLNYNHNSKNIKRIKELYGYQFKLDIIRVFIAILILIGIFGGAILTHRLGMKEWSSFFMHCFLFGAICGLLLGERSNIRLV
jgi:hypothetical protein